VSIGRLLMRRLLLCGVAGFWAAWAVPASAQALGDADCPGGYYFHPAYSQCVPYGSEYLPPDYAYAPPVYMAPYGPNYLFLGGPIDHDRDRRDAHRRTFDAGRDRR
jgi:hypothetical protein